MKAHQQSHAGVTAQPLYVQVRERLMERVVNKEWQQGQMLPNEFDLARQFGVSIGTIRKAVEGLEAAKIVVRKQGRGTFVARGGTVAATEPVSWFVDVGLDIETVETRTLGIVQRAGTDRERQALGLEAGTQVIAIRRRRAFAGEAVVIDEIALPQHLFFDLEPSEPLPGNLYEFYGDYFGVRAAKCSEQLVAVTVPNDEAAPLGVTPGAPVLKIERISQSSAGEPIEWRQSYCLLPKGLSLAGAC
jgi:GntR family transcriptional regulator